MTIVGDNKSSSSDEPVIQSLFSLLILGTRWQQRLIPHCRHPTVRVDAFTAATSSDGGCRGEAGDDLRSDHHERRTT